MHVIPNLLLHKKKIKDFEIGIETNHIKIED